MNTFFNSLADVIFPPRCLRCGLLIREDEATSLCRDCRAKIRLIKSPLCPLCGISYNSAAEIDHLCGDCLREKPPFFLARAWGYYEGELIEAIHQFKYQGKTAWGKVLGGLMAETSYPGLSLKTIHS